jgi:hypothetical protein
VRARALPAARVLRVVRVLGATGQRGLELR